MFEVLPLSCGLIQPPGQWSCSSSSARWIVQYRILTKMWAGKKRGRVLGIQYGAIQYCSMRHTVCYCVLELFNLLSSIGPQAALAILLVRLVVSMLSEHLLPYPSGRLKYSVQEYAVGIARSSTQWSTTRCFLRTSANHYIPGDETACFALDRSTTSTYSR